MLPTKTITCWKTIGIQGDRSCPELREWVHCHNCPIYASAARDLLNQPLPRGYQDDWATVLATPMVSDRSPVIAPTTGAIATCSIAVFRLQDEWFGLATPVCQAITPIVPVRRIPQRSNDVLLGLVNIGGELQLCVSLAQLLGLSPPSNVTLSNVTLSNVTPSNVTPSNVTPSNVTPSDMMSVTPNQAKPAKRADWTELLIYPRMLVIQLLDDRWVFPVDDIYGIERFPRDRIQPAPTNVSQMQQHLTQGVIEWRGNFISYLDAERLSQSLHRRALP
jgi:chemotaxis-related protein WspD